MPEFARRERDRAPGRSRGVAPAPAVPLLALQRVAGNRAARSILARAPVEADTQPDTQRREASIEISGLGSVSLLSWGFASTSQGPSGGRVGNRDIDLSSRGGALSPRLLQAAAGGRHFDTAVLTGSRMTITLTDVMVTSYARGSGEGDLIDNWTINYRGIESNPTSGG